jgi:hypothetical protein
MTEARKGLDALSQLVTDANFSSLGFQTKTEVQRATLGKPVARHFVGYDRLLKASPNVAFATLLETQEQAVYPVLVGDAIRTSILLTRTARGWQISSIGDASLGRLLQHAGPVGAANIQLVSVPGLNLDFVGVGQGASMQLIPALDYPEVKLVRERRVKANEFVPVLVAYAKAFDRTYGEQLRRRELVK